MITRLLPRPKDSFFLFGPRGTGKSTLLKSWFPDALWMDLLSQTEIFRLMSSPGAFAQAVEGQPKDRWIVVDEIQKIPRLLDEVHRLMENGGYRFALSGSSARKLKRGGANLLAGRAFVYRLFPLTRHEMLGHSGRDVSLEFGGLPKIALERDPAVRIERLRAYVGTYLSEEIRAEALARNIESFSRFLRLAALANGQVTNLSNIARDAAASRTAVKTYFSILEDTLIGSFLPAWQPRLKVKEMNHPKFYFFDNGVYRELTDRLGDRPTPEEKGVLFESAVFQELRAAQEYQRKRGILSYWRTHEGVEVDFVWQRGERVVAIEAKSTDHWKTNFSKGLLSLRSLAKKPLQCLGVYAGPRRLKLPFGFVYPFDEFSTLLQTGKLL
jgi:predicted AAA+ superfamily ATPase